MHNSIRTRLIVTLIGLAISPLLLGGVILARQSFITQEQQALTLQREVALRVAGQVEAFFRGVEDQLRLVSRVQGLRGLDRDRQESVLSELLLYQDVFEELILCDSQGQVQVHLARLRLNPTDLGQRAGADEFTVPRTSGRAYYSSVRFDEATGEPLVTVSVPLFDVRSGLVDKVLVSEVRLKKIWDLIAGIQVSPGQSVYIVDAQGNVVAHRDPSTVLRGTRFDVPDRDDIQPGLAGSRVVLAVSQIHPGQQTFHIVAEQTTSEALALGANAVRITIGLVIAMLVLSGALGLLMVRQIVQPIETMATTAHAISAGDLSRQVPASRRDELGTLAEAFNDMTSQLGAVIGDLEQQITDRRRAEKALRESEERHREAQRTARLGHWSFDVQRERFLWFSEETFRLLGFDPTYGLPDYPEFVAHVHPDDRQPVSDSIAHALASGDPFTLEFRVLQVDGQVHFLEARGTVRRGADGKAAQFTGTVMDVTERKQAEEENRRLNEELEQRVVERTAQLAAANRELEAFSYSVSHDLRAPLRAIDGYTRILVEDHEAVLGAEGKRVCDIIVSQTQQMGKLIDDLLAFSRLSQAEMRMSPINMETLAHSVFQELTTPEERKRIEFRLDPMPPAVGDPTLIHQVWTNLLSNALKFSADRERIVIQVRSEQEGGESIYSVSDNGAGFDMRYVGKLFDVFQRLHSEREFEGTGVGLAIVQQIIHRHGGRVWAEGQVDRGATIHFALPQRSGQQ